MVVSPARRAICLSAEHNPAVMSPMNVFPNNTASPLGRPLHLPA
jgi:hypothetical protein